MRDGVRLATWVVRPSPEAAGPCILQRTPYPGDMERFAEFGAHFVAAGYTFILQHARGRGGSEGTYRPYDDDFDDGYDAVEWAAAQPWCGGAVGMVGSSARGIAALYAAAAAPPSLRAAVVYDAPSSRLTDAYVGGAFKARDYVEWGRGLDLPDLWFERAATGYADAARWDRHELQRLRPHIRIPIHFVGGWYDVFAEGAISNFRFLQHQGAEGARGRQRLTLGPTGHGELSGDLAYPLGAVDRAALSLAWFDRWMRPDAPLKPEADGPPVRAYMMAAARAGAPSSANRWIGLDDWPPAAEPVRFHLQDGGGLALAPAAAPGGTSYTSDPGRPVPTVGGPNLTFARGPMDQRAIGGRADVLRYVTPPLQADLVVAGAVSVELWLSSDAPDTDVIARLVDVYPDGYEAVVLEGALRTRYRNGRTPETVSRLEPGEAVRLEIPLGDVAITFGRGRRIALHLASSSVPRFDVNPQTGDPPSREGQPRIAVNTVHVGGDRPSALILPVLSGG